MNFLLHKILKHKLPCYSWSQSTLQRGNGKKNTVWGAILTLYIKVYLLMFKLSTENSTILFCYNENVPSQKKFQEKDFWEINIKRLRSPRKKLNDDLQNNQSNVLIKIVSWLLFLKLHFDSQLLPFSG